MSDKVTRNSLRKAGLVAIVAAAIGGVAAGVFAAVWFRYTAGNCGVVRFYEQAFGVIVLGAWGLGTGAGALLVLVGRRRGIAAAAAGSGLVVLASAIMVSVCVKTIRDIRAADYSLKSTDQLLGRLTGDDLDARKLAAHALGERRAPEAVPTLCVILEDLQSDIHLRHSAALALGKIGGHEARTALEKTRDACNDDQLRQSIDAALRTMEETQR